MGAVTTRHYRINALSIEVKATEKRAENAEEIARMVDSRTVEGEAMVRRAEATAVAVEERASAAERRAAEAVDDFCKSTSCTDELAKASMDFYLQGFRNCREKVARVFGLFSVADIEPDEGSKGSPSDDGPVAVEP